MKSANIKSGSTAEEIVVIARQHHLPIWTDGKTIIACEYRPDGFHFFGAADSDMDIFHHPVISASPAAEDSPRNLIERMAAAADARIMEIRDRLMGRRMA